MTLMEIVVSLAIYAVIALLLVQIMTTVNSTMTATSQLNKRLSYESKYADNRMKDTGNAQGKIEPLNKKVSLEIKTSPTAENMALNRSNSAGTVYQVKYNSDNVQEYVDKVNYKYMVFDQIPPEDGPNMDLIYTIPMRFDGTLPYTLVEDENHPIRVYMVAEDGTVASENLGYDDVNIPVVDSKGQPVYETVEGVQTKKWLLNQPRIVGDMTNGFEIRVPRKQPTAGVTSGTYEVEVRIYADLRSLTGGVNKKIKDQTTNEEHDSQDFPYVKFRLKYCAWTMDANNKVLNFFEEPGKRFVINSDSTVTTEDYTIPVRPGQEGV